MFSPIFRFKVPVVLDFLVANNYVLKFFIIYIVNLLIFIQLLMQYHTAIGLLPKCMVMLNIRYSFISQI